MGKKTGWRWMMRGNKMWVGWDPVGAVAVGERMATTRRVSTGNVRVVGALLVVGACGPSLSGPIEGGSGESGETAIASASEDGPETLADSDSDSDGDSTDAGAEACVFGPIGGVQSTITGGFRRTDDRLSIRLGSSVSRECGAVGCGGWQLSLGFAVPSSGPLVLGQEVSVVHTSVYSSCAPDVPGEICAGCTEDDREKTDETTPWTGTIEVVSDEDECLQLRVLDSDLLRLTNEPDSPDSFGVNVSRCP